MRYVKASIVTFAVVVCSATAVAESSKIKVYADADFHDALDKAAKGDAKSLFSIFREDAVEIHEGDPVKLDASGDIQLTIRTSPTQPRNVPYVHSNTTTGNGFIRTENTLMRLVGVVPVKYELKVVGDNRPLVQGVYEVNLVRRLDLQPKGNVEDLRKPAISNQVKKLVAALEADLVVLLVKKPNLAIVNKGLRVRGKMNNASSVRLSGKVLFKIGDYLAEEEFDLAPKSTQDCDVSVGPQKFERAATRQVLAQARHQFHMQLAKIEFSNAGHAPGATATSELPPTKAETRGRVWKDVSGTFSVEAEVVEVVGDMVRLRRLNDGTVITVPIDKSYPAEREFLTRLSK